MNIAAKAINSLGVDLLAGATRPNENALLSPYSIQDALAMAYAGAEGVTRTEMAKVLHYANGEAEVHLSFAALRKALDDVAEKSAKQAEQLKQWGLTNDTIALTVANRLFGQAGYDFRPAFLALVKDNYVAPFEPLDFVKDPAGATDQINIWVENQTRQRIRNLIPGGALDQLTRLVLVNAIYLKAPWPEEFPAGSTKPRPLHLARGKTVDVPTMSDERSVGYARRDGFSIVAVPYSSWDIQFLILLPDKVDDLTALEARLTANLLAECANLREQKVILYLPKFKMEPPVFPLGKPLQLC